MERPIIFSGPMVRAILSGNKTQTRRVVKKKLYFPTDPGIGYAVEKGRIKCPYGVPGDRLWVRETCVRFTGITFEGGPWPVCGWKGPKHNQNPYQALLPKAGNENHIEKLNNAAACVTVPSIFMPRWASRITLEIEDIRVERLQDISEEDAKAEGIIKFSDMDLYGHDPNGTPGPMVGGSYSEAFMLLWDSINAKKHSWESNPWVWVISFHKV